ncbi:hypothetical protein C3747_60g113 [Trypanosoma cruzi]|uniref:Glycosyltransferase n=1 Tax=Trypanosoma cruzi TaxID=5693 RepID=A0A2V2WUN7_TRYCR|nr:hypothetical protein C3747_60g113 [Trypanosoma cruzi]
MTNSLRVAALIYLFFLLFVFFLTRGEAAPLEELVLPYCVRGWRWKDVPEEAENPDVQPGGIGTVRTYKGCFQKVRDRFVVVTPTRTKPSPRSLPPCQHFLQRNETLQFHYLSSDICRMGHTTKDAPHLMTFLMDYFAPCSTPCQRASQGESASKRLRVELTVLYGNVCTSYPAPKLDEAFQKVILGWFHAVFRGDSPFIELMGSWGIDFVPPAGASGSGALLIKEVSYKMAMSYGGFFCTRDEGTVPTTYTPASMVSERCTSGLWIITRWERFRWFRTRAQASLFRRCLLHYYKVPPRTGDHSLLLHRRLNERHFDELHWQKKLQACLEPRGVSVMLQTFISMEYHRQASFMHNSSIFIAAHGAGMVNIMSMSPGSVVVELFPHGFRYAMYQELAELLGLHYIAYESPSVWPPRCCIQREKGSAAQHTPPLHGTPPRTSFGMRSCKGCDINVLEEDMEAILFDALGIVSADICLHSASI